MRISQIFKICWFLGPFSDGRLVLGRFRRTRPAAQWSEINWYLDLSWSSRSVDSLDHSLMVIWSWVLDSTGVGANSGDPRNYSPNSWLWNHFTELEFSEFETGNVEKTETIRSRFIRGVWKWVRMHATARQYTYRYYTYTISGNYRRRSQRHLQVQW